MKFQLTFGLPGIRAEARSSLLGELNSFDMSVAHSKQRSQ
jgi:hypothetical protein